MKKNGYTVKPFPRNRRLVVDAGYMAHRRHVIHGMGEVDVTEVKKFFEKHKTRTGATLSFTAFIIACVGKAVEMNKYMHAYRDWRGRLILFDDVDVHTPIESEMNQVALTHVIRNANRKSFLEIHKEIREIQVAPEANPLSGKIKWFVMLPGFIRRLFYWIFAKNPHWWKKYGGTVVVTAIGMIGEVPGWGIPFGNHTLCFTLGGIKKKPGVVDGRIEIRDYLYLTMTMDHDIIDGAPAARFFDKLMNLIETGYGLTE